MGVFVLSFDFELAWGPRVNSTLVDHGAGMEATVDVVHGLLAMLNHHRVSATWATVGHLMLDPSEHDVNQDLYYTPAPKPSWFRGGWYQNVPAGDDYRTRRYYAPDLVQAIVDCPTYQELASHTFTHADLSDDECSPATALAELETCRTLGARFNREITSLVFPRNQLGNLEVVNKTGHRCYRGPFNEWYRIPGIDRLGGRLGTLLQRSVTGLLRWFDEWCAFTPRTHTASICHGMCETPHSMFFPGSVGPSRSVPRGRLAAKAIKGLEHAAAGDGVFSLFTHPHNFLPHAGSNLACFERIIQHAAALRDSGRLTISTMDQLADTVLDARAVPMEAAA